MTTIKTKKFLIAVICIVLAITFSGCTETFNIVQEVTNVVAFVEEVQSITEVLQNTDLTQKEQLDMIKEAVLHEKSNIDIDTAINDIKEKANISDTESINSFSLVSTPDPSSIISSLEYNEAIGGNTYTMEMVVEVNGVTITVEVTLLSDKDGGLGIYDYTLK